MKTGTKLPDPVQIPDVPDAYFGFHLPQINIGTDFELV
jgi:hypothetical protein